MILDGMIVAVVVASAVAYLVWHFLPRRKAPSPCAACPAKGRHGGIPARSA
jgi:hypothetical protein